MRTRLLATTGALLACLTLAAGCGDESVSTTDPGQTVAPSAAPTSAPPDSAGSATATPSTAPGIGRALRAFARGGEPPPMAGEVQLYLGNAFTGVVTASDGRSAWATCTELGSYAGATCPLSPLTSVRRAHGIEEVARPQGPCLATYGRLPPDLRRLDRTVLAPRPASIDTCARNFAIQLFTDEAGDLVAVSTLLGEP